MTVQQGTRNPAAAKLESLARCTRIVHFQAGDEDDLCANDLIPLTWYGNHWEHDHEYIRRLRAATYDGRWPGE